MTDMVKNFGMAEAALEQKSKVAGWRAAQNRVVAFDIKRALGMRGIGFENNEGM